MYVMCMVLHLRCNMYLCMYIQYPKRQKVSLLHLEVIQFSLPKFLHTWYVIYLCSCSDLFCKLCEISGQPATTPELLSPTYDPLTRGNTMLNVQDVTKVGLHVCMFCAILEFA